MDEHTFFDNIPKESKIFISNWCDISERIQNGLRRNSISDSSLAEHLGITTRRLRTYLDCPYNFSIKTLAKIEAFIGEPIITVNNT